MKNLHRVVIVLLTLIADINVIAQKQNPDSVYFIETKKMNRTFVRAHPDECLNIFKQLNKKYRLLSTDIIVFWQLSAPNNDSNAFYQSGRLMIENSGEKLSSLSKSYLSKFSITEHPFLARAYKRLESEENTIIDFAKLHLDWKAIIFINDLATSNIDFRYIPIENFKDTAKWLTAMAHIDSMHLDRLRDFVLESGFPKMSKVGLSAGKLQPVIKHTIALVVPGHNTNYERSISCWKTIFPAMYECAKRGEMEPDFYRSMHTHFVQYLRAENKIEDVRFFMQYSIY